MRLMELAKTFGKPFSKFPKLHENTMNVVESGVFSLLLELWKGIMIFTEMLSQHC